jgi:hypothetical protein
MPKINVKKVLLYSPIFLTIIAYFLFLIIFGYWDSILTWVLGIVLAVVFSIITYFSMSRLTWTYKQSIAFILLCVLVTAPFYIVSGTIDYQRVSQNLSTPREISYFRNALGRSYNYEELIIWENQHLKFSSEDIERNSDPIKIYEYGKGMCREFAILYAELCVCQGYSCRIVQDFSHAWDEIYLNDTWTRVDASLNDTSSRAIGYPMFFEKEKGWIVPILALAFENSSIIDVTGTYNSNHWSLLSPLPVAVLIFLFASFILVIVKFLIVPMKKAKNQTATQERGRKT